MANSSLIFTIKRGEPELIGPAKPTPYEFKNLSDIDDQKSLRIQFPFIHFYPSNARMQGSDPVKIIKEAIGETLVYYYPLAGRVRKGLNDKLVVECTGEGVMFIEADAHVRLEQFGDVLHPPFQREEDLLYDVPGFGGILHSPLLFIQVTRLTCGGFIFALRMNHTICDAIGLLQFMNAVSEIACGASVPSVLPIWNRERLNAPNPSLVLNHQVHQTGGMHVDDMVHRSFFVSLQDITTIRSRMPPHLRTCSKFDILTACMWRCRTIAFTLNSDESVYLGCAVNTRDKFAPPLPVGFYGNAFAMALAQSTAGELCQNPLEYALQLVKRAKVNVTGEELRKPWTDPSVKKGWPHFITAEIYYVSDFTHLLRGFKAIDFGWGKAVYGGPTGTGSLASLLLPSTNSNGEDGIIVTIKLPESNMEKFAIEVDKMINGPNGSNSSFIVSPL